MSSPSDGIVNKLLRKFGIFIDKKIELSWVPVDHDHWTPIYFYKIKNTDSAWIGPSGFTHYRKKLPLFFHLFNKLEGMNSVVNMHQERKTQVVVLIIVSHVQEWDTTKEIFLKD